MQHLPARRSGSSFLRRSIRRGERLVEVAVLVEEVAALRAQAAEPAAEHVLAEHEVRAVRTTAAVEALLRSRSRCRECPSWSTALPSR